MSKRRTNISIDPNVYEKAKELGINISQTSERALQIRIGSARQGTPGSETPAPLALTLAEQNSAAPTQDELRATYRELDADELRVAFLILATSGIRRRELIELTAGDFDRDDRVIYPSTHDGQRTKRQWVTFYSPRAGRELERVYDFDGMDSDEPIITFHRDTVTRRIRQASERVEATTITPQTLRVWFSNEMNRLGVADRYIDAFSGRTPTSTLAKHYSDYTPRKLQEVYANAGIAVFD